MEPSAWPEVSAAVAAAPYPVAVLPVDPQRAATCLAALGVTTRSWLGALVTNAGDLLVDHCWLRVLASGHDRPPDLLPARHGSLRTTSTRFAADRVPTRFPDAYGRCHGTNLATGALLTQTPDVKDNRQILWSALGGAAAP